MDWSELHLCHQLYCPQTSNVLITFVDPVVMTIMCTPTHSPFQFPEHPYRDLLDKVLLYRHSSDDALVPLEANDLIEDGSIIEIVLKGEASCIKTAMFTYHSSWYI